MHLLIHYLDNIRSGTASSCVGNGPESLVEIVIGVVVWQKLLGPRVKAWHARELAKHHDALKSHIAAEFAKRDNQAAPITPDGVSESSERN